MASLVVDIGNTFAKVGVFEQHELLYHEQYENIGVQIIDQLLAGYQIDKGILCSVNNVGNQWVSAIEGKIPLVYFTQGMANGITNHYRTPATLGLDRLAAIMGVINLYPSQNNLVIDGGTCITYDFVDIAGNYNGGSISPGLRMRYKALNYYTAGLPLIDTETNFTADYGDDTISAIRSGVQNGIKYELYGFIKAYQKNTELTNIVLTGGDSIFFDTLLKNSIFAPCIKNEPCLVLKGLNAALQNNND
jgi:type III pantothenate kinase